ncbi:MAG: VOC family protein, partial [Actinomycetota bacterium]|nr:VOC family protein [Actinomycetota bacterium]
STYRMCSLRGRDVAGISDAGTLHGGRRGWITYFAVDDIEDSARRAVALGGELLTPPRYLPAAGAGGAVTDPYGAVFGLYQGETRVGVEMLNEVGALCWNELDTGEPEASVDFYRSLFGFGAERRDSPTSQPYTVLTLGDVPVAGVLELDNDWPNLIPSQWIAYFNVASLPDALNTVVSLGGTPSVGPIASPHGALHLVRDPAGNTLCLIELEDGLRPDTLPHDPAVTA